ncbi:MAG: DUF1667 domain-containing protein [Anaerolineae bacterium]
MSEQREYICVTCPVGCTIDAIVEGGELVSIQGQACKRGQAFVREEIHDPRRTLTTTVRVRGGALPLAPVRSSAPLPKGLVMRAAEILRSLTLDAPVEAQQVIVRDILGSGIDVVTTRAIAPLGEAAEV